MDAISAFTTYVKRVDIENYNLCNRQCPTCPQSLGIRSKELEYFEYALFEKLLDELAFCRYTETLALGRYHEPLFFPELTLERIRIAKKRLPEMRIIMNTNGDFITPSLIKELANAGLSEIKIMRYQAEKYSTTIGEKMCSEMATKLGKCIIKKNLIDSEVCYIQLENEGSLIISVRSENYYSSRGNNRGGLLANLATQLRTTACTVPLRSIDIDYNGNVMPCCNMISDSLIHTPFIIGNIKEKTIFNLYWESINSVFFKAISHCDFENNSVCKYCTYVF